MPSCRAPDAPRDRYADAVRARRAELREHLDRAALPHRSELRDALLLTRAAVGARAGEALARLRHEVDAYPTAPPLPLVVDATRSITGEAHRQWARQARGVARRVAAARGLPLPADWPELPPAPVPAAVPRPPRPVRLTDALGDAGAWRLAVLPLAVAPLTGFAGPAVLLPALGAGLLVLVTAVRARQAAAGRARDRRWCADLLTDARTRVDAELAHRVVALAATVGTHLDTALARRRADLADELRILAAAGG